MEENGLKNTMEKLGIIKKKGNEIITNQLKIKENTIYYSWNNGQETAIQISNISQIDIGSAPKEKISLILIFLFLAGFFLISLKQFIFGLILILVSGVIIYFILQENKQVGDNLIIYLNNGNYFLFNFKEKDFLLKVYQLLIECINHRVSGEKIISISNSQIYSSAIGENNSI